MPAHLGCQKLPPTKVARLFKLRGDGLSLSQVAKRLECHRNTVWNYEQRKAENVAFLETLKGSTAMRCPECGVVCKMPCVLCLTREATKIPCSNRSDMGECNE
ncbi:hypothetical protein [Botrimarina mediterranea]|uniref:Uncharacterized protein n=1 Tax=Botrimarina mediterranea TaxID=2528022 RepID=A0A518K922_9BACT|nr:hypothetical protein [Botrimarina mediterranea]QDV74273.1 hypothetical protein Spa11_24740 [Botrimarina mediterranea]